MTDVTDPLEQLGAIPTDEAFTIDRMGFEFFHANVFTSWVRCSPGVFNILCSMWYLERPKNQGEADVEVLRHARKVFIDSGLNTPLSRVMRGQEKPAVVEAHLERQPDLMLKAWEVWEGGTTDGVVCHIDHLCGKDTLLSVGKTLDQALAVTIRNAVEWQGLHAPPEWKKVYAVQGQTVETYGYCMDAYEEAGILDEVRSGAAWLAIGSIGLKKPPTLYTIVEYVRERLGEQGWIHALAIGAPTHLRAMVGRGWIQSSDSLRPTLKAAMNLGPYRVEGPRRFYLYLAQMAAGAELFETELYEELHRGALQRSKGERDMDELQEKLL